LISAVVFSFRRITVVFVSSVWSLWSLWNISYERTYERKLHPSPSLYSNARMAVEWNEMKVKVSAFFFSFFFFDRKIRDQNSGAKRVGAEKTLDDC